MNKYPIFMPCDLYLLDLKMAVLIIEMHLCDLPFDDIFKEVLKVFLRLGVSLFRGFSIPKYR